VNRSIPWKSYFRWHVSTDRDQFAEDLFDENFAFFGKLWQASRRPNRAGSSAVPELSALGEAVGQDWVKQYFPPAAKGKYGQTGCRSRKSHWATTSRLCLGWAMKHKKAAEEKLALFRNKIGYPESGAVTPA